jgi:SAM-dependent methyltransferase
VGLLLNPSDWIVRWSHLLVPGCSVLDVACGSGRHLDWFARKGHPVTGVDQDVEQAGRNVPMAELVRADIENNAWPLQTDGTPRRFGAVVVTNYLWRPLLQTLVDSVAPGGVLLYETFTLGNAAFGRPSRPDFLLQSGELLRHCAQLDIVAYENGHLDNPARQVQRIAAVRPVSSTHSVADMLRLSL